MSWKPYRAISPIVLRVPPCVATLAALRNGELESRMRHARSSLPEKHHHEELATQLRNLVATGTTGARDLLLSVAGALDCSVRPTSDPYTPRVIIPNSIADYVSLDAAGDLHIDQDTEVILSASLVSRVERGPRGDAGYSVRVVTNQEETVYRYRGREIVRDDDGGGWNGYPRVWDAVYAIDRDVREPPARRA